MSHRLERLIRLREPRRPRLTIAQVLDWADAHQAATGTWPTTASGTVQKAPWYETWKGINAALVSGGRGLPGGSSLHRLLREQRGVKPRLSDEAVAVFREKYQKLMAERDRRGGREPLSVDKILAWADAHHAAAGTWPTFQSGPIAGAPGETWSTINEALRRGRDGLPGPTTLLRFLLKHRGRLLVKGIPDLTIEQILAWADAYHQAHSCWPIETSGAVAEAPHESWSRISAALTLGRRGLPGGSSLARLLAERRGVRNPRGRPRLTIDQVLAWADAHRAATGDWPVSVSGAIPGAPGEDWKAIDGSLRQGNRGLPKGSSLSRLLNEHRPEGRKRLTLEMIRRWVETHERVHGHRPSAASGPILGAPGEDWARIDTALRHGRRGLPGGSSLARLFGRALNRSVLGIRPQLTLDQVLSWGEAHHTATGRWPGRNSGPVLGAPGEKWVNIDQALRQGARGLPRGTSLARLFANRPIPTSNTTPGSEMSRPA